MMVATACLGGDEAPRSVDDLYQEGWYQQSALRDFEQAILRYERIVRESGVQEELAGRACLRLGECHEALGKTEQAAEYYRRAQKLFGAQEEAAREAREKLERLARKTDAPEATEPPVTVFVESLGADGQKERLQLRAGDILLEYDGRPARNVRTLLAEIPETSGRASVNLLVQRRGDRIPLVCRGGMIGVQLAQSAGTGVPYQLSSDNYRDLQLALTVGQEEKRAELLRELAKRKNLTLVEQSALIDASFDHVAKEPVRKSIQDRLISNPAFTSAASEHLQARLGETTSPARDEITEKLFRITWNDGPLSASSAETSLSFGAGFESWRGRYKVDSAALEGSSRNTDGNGVSIGASFKLWEGDPGRVGFSRFSASRSGSSKRPIDFRGHTFPAGQRIEESVAITDVWASSIPLRYRRIEIEVEGGGTRKEKSLDLLMLGTAGVEFHGGSDASKTRGLQSGIAFGDLSFRRWNFLWENKAYWRYPLSRDWNLELSYTLEYFKTQGQGTTIEDIQHGPFARLTFDW